MNPPKPSQVALALGIAYAALLVWGWIAVSRRGPAPWARREPAEWVAARDLAALAQLDSSDLAAPDDTTKRKLPNRAGFVGQHLVAAKRRGAPVSSADVAAFSVGDPRPGTIRFVFAARGGDAPALTMARSGERLSPCVAVAGVDGAPTTWDCSGDPFTVVAVHRPAGMGDTIWAVLETVDAEQAARFAGATGRLLIRRP